MRVIIILALAGGIGWGQVAVSISVVPHSATGRLLNRRASNICSVWIGAARNDGTERVLLAESALISAMARYQPFDHTAMSLLVQDASTYSLLARLGRGGQDVTALAAFVAAQRAWGAPWIEILTGVAWGAPYVVGRIRGIERPISQNFETLAAGWPLSLDIGQSAVFHCFTRRQPDATPPATFTLGAGAPVRLVQ